MLVRGAQLDLDCLEGRRAEIPLSQLGCSRIAVSRHGFTRPRHIIPSGRMGFDGTRIVRVCAEGYIQGRIHEIHNRSITPDVDRINVTSSRITIQLNSCIQSQTHRHTGEGETDKHKTEDKERNKCGTSRRRRKYRVRGP